MPAGAVAPFNTSTGFWLEHAAPEQPAYTTYPEILPSSLRKGGLSEGSCANPGLGGENIWLKPVASHRKIFRRLVSFDPARRHVDRKRSVLPSSVVARLSNCARSDREKRPIRMKLRIIPQFCIIEA